MLDSLAIVKTPKAARRLFPAALWKVRTREKILYLTFDDGPIEEVTPIVLDILKEYDARATFFCIGKNINANPALFHRITEEGHTVGNHTQEHFNGWQTENKTYFENVEKCAVTKSKNMLKPELVYGDDDLDANTETDTVNFFRPPYGKLTLSQYNKLKKTYKIVMWDVLTFDFDLKVTKEQVLDNVLQNSVPGSIIVFHDSLKASEKMLYALPRMLEHYTNLGYRFETLPE
jgi:peptidoglycan/xylan/chitin deacetylase (PgdA/CDA1 family)